jgi:hypothetical protein
MHPCLNVQGVFRIKDRVHEIWYTEEGCQSVVGVYFWSMRNVVVQQCSAKRCQKIYFRDDLRATLDEGPRSKDQ